MGRKLSCQEVENFLDIDYSLIWRWTSTQDVLKASPTNVKTVTVSGYSRHPRVDNELIKWATKQIEDEELLTRQHLASMALFYAKELEDDEFQAKSWEAILSWVSRFMERYNLVHRRVTSSNGGVNALVESREVQEFFEKLQRKVTENGMRLIQLLNMDETGVWFETEPRYTITFKGARNARVCCSNAAKTRATVVLCCAADGSKMKPAIIFKATTEGSLQQKYDKSSDGFPAGVFIWYHEKAWNTEMGMVKWIHHVLGPTLEEFAKSFDESSTIVGQSISSPPVQNPPLTTDNNPCSGVE